MAGREVRSRPAKPEVTETFQPRPAEGLKYPNIVQMFAARRERSPHAPALRHKQAGVWRTLSWRQWWDAARELAAGLRAQLGIERGQRIALLSPTRLEWILCDLAVAMTGGVSVPIYTSLTADNVSYILQDADCRWALVDHAGRLAPSTGKDLAQVVVFDSPPSRVDSERPLLGLDELREAGRKALEADGGKEAAALDALADELGLDDPLTFVYTSGTTGQPKGVVINHRNLVYEAWAIKNVVPVDETDEQLLVLPLAHIFARHMVWGAVEQGAVTSVSEGDAYVFANLLEVAPTFVGGVPRIYEKAYARVMREVVGRSAVTKRAFELALEVGRKVSGYRQRAQVPPTSLALRYAVADKAFFSRIRGQFGGRLRFLVSGGAPLSKDIAEFFHAAGVLILEGYGLSETTGATNVNRPDRFRFGTVGPAMPGCEIRIAEDGEVLVRGHNVMAGYHKLPEDTKAAFDEHGWFRTGDIGELRDGFLRITDRKKDLFKTTAGKYVAPRVIEGRLRLKEGIGHAVVCGEGRPYAVALLALDEDALMRMSEREGLGCRSYRDLAVHPRIRQLCQSHVDDVNATLARYEAVKRFAITPAPLTVEGGELTPTGKVRKKTVLSSYGSVVDGLYDSDGLAPPASADGAPQPKWDSEVGTGG